MVELPDRVVKVDMCDWARERADGSRRTDTPRPVEGEVDPGERNVGDDLPLPPAASPAPNDVDEPAASGDEILGKFRSRPGDRGGRMGAPFAVAPCGTAGMSNVRTGGSGFNSMSSAPASASESRLAMLAGTDARNPAELRGGGSGPPPTPESDCPYAPRCASEIETEEECGGMYAIGITLVRDERNENSESWIELASLNVPIEDRS